MIPGNCADLRILEVVRISRTQNRIKTVNKSCYVISCRIHGESTFFYNGQSHTVRRGDVLFIPAKASYCQECETEEIVAIHLDIAGYTPHDIRIFTPDDPDEMCELFQNLSHDWQQKNGNSIYYCLSGLYKIAAISNLFDTSQAEDVFGVIAPSIRYLRAHLYDTDLTLETVYKQSHVSQTSFIKHFRSHFHCTPVQYVNQLRIQKAQTLLSSRLYTRKEIAFLCGYENIKHFYVVFKKLTGCTTGEYLEKGANL